MEPLTTHAHARPTGGSVAAMLAAAFGLLVLALVQVGTVVSTGFRDAVFAVGKAWVPNAQGIGPYSGKETLMLVAWPGWAPGFCSTSRCAAANPKSASGSGSRWPSSASRRCCCGHPCGTSWRDTRGTRRVRIPAHSSMPTAPGLG